MKITDGKTLNAATNKERANQEAYLDGLAVWKYTYIRTNLWAILKKCEANYTTWGIEHIDISPQEIWIVALASRYLKSDMPKNERELAEMIHFQFKLEEYLWITNPKVVTDFYSDLIGSVKSEHNKLIPILDTYHTQIHALKIGYDRIKWIIKNSDITTRVIFGLICIEFMKLHVRLYLVEPLARTKKGENLDWIYMLDKVFEDFSIDSPYNKESLRRKNVVPINLALESSLQWALRHIKEIRDHVAELKTQKQQWKDIENSEHTYPINNILALKVIADVKKKLGGGTL